LVVSRRPSVFVLALTVGDYLLWNWSLNGGHDVLALVSGLTLPPLALVSFWVLAMAGVRGLAVSARALRGRGERARSARTQATRASAGTRARPASNGAARPAGRDSGRIAA
jgi:hypothetical protein